ncbi:MAG: isocitrate/isopropylmalate dehydrogenase family protein [Chloroflexi bacterium]|nr:isocitrate/isopropylmalate dehydrogenase family protein [Chloroflexota bacterium]
MARYRIGVLEGDGIGPEVVGAALQVVEAVTHSIPGLTLDLIPLPVGLAAIHTHGVALPPSTVAALEECHGWIMGPHDSESYPPAERAKRNPSGELRRRFDLYANIRPARTFSGVPSLAPAADLVVVRENTEGFYADRNMAQGAGEFMPTPDVALAVGVFTRRGAERIARTAFRLAQGRRRSVTIVHKYNVLRLTYGLFLETCRAVAREFPDVAVEDYHIDAMAAHLVRRPGDFDVIVTTNMFGDILSDLAGELVGSLGMAGALNAGDERAMAQATHGSAPDIAGRGIANPVGGLLSTALLLHWLGDRHGDPGAHAAGERIEAAVAATLTAGVRTPDLGGSARTLEFAEAVQERIAAE